VTHMTTVMPVTPAGRLRQRTGPATPLA
jgi:hypothetical protein